MPSLVGSEMCIRDRWYQRRVHGDRHQERLRKILPTPIMHRLTTLILLGLLATIVTSQNDDQSTLNPPVVEASVTNQATNQDDIALPTQDANAQNLASQPDKTKKLDDTVKTKTKEIKDKVNQGNHGWKAKAYGKFADKSLKELKRYLGGKYFKDPSSIVEDDGTMTFDDAVNFLQVDQIPTAYNWTQVWSNCSSDVRDQGQCGSCWAFSAAGVLQDRLCQVSKGTKKYTLSPQNLVACDTNDLGCEGGYIDYAWAYIMNYGIRNDSCIPYTDAQYVDMLSGTCPTSCANNANFSKTYKANYPRRFTTADAAKTEIKTRGPIQAMLNVYEDFYNYETGIYSYVDGALIGGHAIQISGWGIENGIKYWICENSWSNGWGEYGYFRIKEGECDIESFLYAGNAINSQED
eukprot:TRINITY_DN23325_c0_g1_i1.p1 TRINITY_DN23325_c0_g1~~TRINITY_DN23325_c0_g1_i1.p1  ORF type:complete len:407 (+),score=141.41 TRINITY_DN23325_c0_g1_i1:108-1328(+)